LADFPGPLAGLLAGLRAVSQNAVDTEATTEWLLSAPCDSPWLPADLAVRLADAARAQGVPIATATTTDAAGEVSLHPVFALVHISLADDLAAFLEAGERKVRAWYARH
ncbi:NTP transferase domain-containing protein, partial [Rhizobium sp. SIMBA_035]